MVAPSVMSLQKAVYETLHIDTALMLMATGIYDHVPQGSAFPYIVFGESAEKPWFNCENGGADQLLTLEIYSRAAGRKQAASIMERLYALLHHAPLTVEGQTLVLLRYAASKIMLEDDGMTYKASMQLRVITQAV